ncbi:hypothetical protein BDV06DRAFT_200883 [Aspergillus oleicola]
MARSGLSPPARATSGIRCMPSSHPINSRDQPQGIPIARAISASLTPLQSPSQYPADQALSRCNRHCARWQTRAQRLYTISYSGPSSRAHNQVRHR